MMALRICARCFADRFAAAMALRIFAHIVRRTTERRCTLQFSCDTFYCAARQSGCGRNAADVRRSVLCLLLIKSLPFCRLSPSLFLMGLDQQRPILRVVGADETLPL